MRKNKKRHIDYINAVLSGEYISIVSKHIIEYLHTQNDTFNPNSISQSDIDELKELIKTIEKRPEYYSRMLAEANIESNQVSKKGSEIDLFIGQIDIYVLEKDLEKANEVLSKLNDLWAI